MLNEVMQAAIKPFIEPQKKASLGTLISSLELLERMIDDMDEITDDAIKLHFDAVEAVDQKTDRLIGFMQRMKMEAANACETAEKWKERARKCEAALERCKGYVKYLLQRYPTLELRGTTGKLALQKNPASLKLNSIGIKSVSLKAILDEDLSVVPERFRVKKEVWVLDNEAIKDALKKGECIGFADLEQGESVRIKI